jgi:hypothetical protein
MLLRALYGMTQPGAILLDGMREDAKRIKDLRNRQMRGEKLTENEETELALSVVDAQPMGLVGGTLSRVGAKALPEASDFIKSLFSRVEGAIVGGPGKAPGKQWLSYLQKAASKDELTHTGLADFLNENLDKTLGRWEVQKAYEQNPVRLNEVIFDANNTPYGTDAIPKFNSAFKVDPQTLQERVIQGELPKTSLTRLRDEVKNKFTELSKNETQLQQEYLDAANLSMTSPYGTPEYNKAYEKSLELYDLYRTAGEARKNFELANPDIDMYMLKYQRAPVQSPHHFFGNDNQVGWGSSVMGEFDGKKALGVTEVQSDAHQAARNVGRLNELGKEIPSERVRLEGRLQDALNTYAEYSKLRGTPGFETSEDYKLSKAVDAATSALKNYGVPYGGASLPLPFGKDGDWQELFLKQILDRAAREGAENIVFPGGKAVSKAVGLPKEGRKVYDRDLPNQLMEYIKKQLGVEVQPQFLQQTSGGLPRFNKMLRAADPIQVGPNQWATPDLPGPLPKGYEEFFGTIPSRSGPATPEVIDEAANSAVEYINRMRENLWSQPIAENPLMANTFKMDARLLSNLLADPIKFTPDGAVIPYPLEARDKVLSNGQRLWSALGLAGIPAADFMMQPKKKEKKKEKKK